MNRTIKKVGATFIVLIFMISGFTSLSIASVQDDSSTKGESQVKTITIYRHDFDGSITPIQIDLSLKMGQDIGEAIADKCDELLENDVELQKLLKIGNNSNGIFGIVSKIKSRGRGLHFKTNIKIKLQPFTLRKIKLFPLLPPYFRPPLILPTIFCRYPNDETAYTEITPLLSLTEGGNETKTFEGPHRVTAVGFIGYKGWIGHFSLLGFGIKTGFSGYTMFARCKPTILS